MDPAAVDPIRLSFSSSALLALNIVIGLMMVGVALDIEPRDFARIVRAPKAPVAGLVAQFLLLPAVTFALVQVFDLQPSIALGMILVAACPGGNVSNLICYLAGGNVAVSITMTAISTLAAVVMTPLNLMFWGHLDTQTAPILRAVSLSPADVFVTVFAILGIPLGLGLWIARRKPDLIDRVRRPFKVFTVVVFAAVVGMALAANFRTFLQVIDLIVLVVAAHNALALATGYLVGLVVGSPARDRRAISIEVGIQNSALGLVLVFNFFDGLGGMAIIVAWWGIWHIIAGLTMAFIWSRTPMLAAEVDDP